MPSIAFTVAACVLAVAAICGLWLDRVALDTEGYLSRIAPLWQEPAIREQAAEEIAAFIDNHVDAERTTELLLPGVPTPLRAMISDHVDALIAPISRGLGAAYVASPSFEKAWRDTNETVHRSIVQQLLAPGDIRTTGIWVEFDIGRAAAEAAHASPIVVASLTGDSFVRELKILDPGEFLVARILVRALNGRGGLLLAAFLLFSVAAVASAPDRILAVSRLAKGIAASMAFLLAGVVLVRRFCVARLSGWYASPSSSEAMFDAVARDLTNAAAVVMVFALATGLIITGVRRRVADGARNDRTDIAS